MTGLSSLREIPPNGNFWKTLNTPAVTELKQCPQVRVTGNVLNGRAIALIALWFRLIRA